MLRGTIFPFSLKKLDVDIERLNPGTGLDDVHTSHIKKIKRSCRNSIFEICNKLITRTYIASSMLEGHIRPTVSESSGNKTDSENYRPAINPSNFLKIIEYLLLPLLEKHLPVHQNQFAYRSARGCLVVITVLKESVRNWKLKSSDLHCAMVDHSKAYDRNNTSLLCGKMTETDLLGMPLHE